MPDGSMKPLCLRIPAAEGSTGSREPCLLWLSGASSWPLDARVDGSPFVWPSRAVLRLLSFQNNYYDAASYPFPFIRRLLPREV